MCRIFKNIIIIFGIVIIKVVFNFFKISYRKCDVIFGTLSVKLIKRSIIDLTDMALKFTITN